jgi:L-iditol 2-dehydrogenase
MKGVVKFKHGLDGTELRIGLKEPVAGPGQVKVKVDTATICGSDVHVLFDNWEGGGRYKFPVILGHEGSGIVTEVGEGVTNYKEGDRVVSETTFTTCKHCEYCYEALYNCCAERVGLGSGVDGFFTEFVIANERSIHLIPENVSLEAAAMTEPLATVVHGIIDQSRVTAGDVALIPGPGPIGLLAAQVVRASGAIAVISGVNRDTNRLDFAKKVLNFEHIVNSQQNDLKAYVMDLTHNRGCDLVYECSGAKPAIAQGFDCLKKRGEFVEIAGVMGNVEIDSGEYVYGKEVNFKGVRSTIPTSWDRSLRLLEYGLVDAESLITHRLPLSDWLHGYELVRDGEAIKVALKPQQ